MLLQMTMFLNKDERLHLMPERSSRTCACVLAVVFSLLNNVFLFISHLLSSGHYIRLHCTAMYNYKPDLIRIFDLLLLGIKKVNKIITEVKSVHVPH